MPFDSSLKRAIRATGLTYATTAAKLGISRNTLERISNGRAATSAETLSKIRATLGDDAAADLAIVKTHARRDETGRFQRSEAP